MNILILFLLCLILCCMSVASITNTPIIQPILQTLLQYMGKIPKTGFPTETFGTVQQTFGTIKSPTIYNAHGIVTPNNPNSLIAYV
jgi:hypothetical protein